MSGLKERLNSKTIAPGAMKKVSGNQVLQEKLDLVDVKLKPIENKGILIEKRTFYLGQLSKFRICQTQYWFVIHQNVSRGFLIMNLY